VKKSSPFYKKHGIYMKNELENKFDFTILRWKIALFLFQYSYLKWLGLLFLTKEDCAEMEIMLTKELSSKHK